MKSRKRKSPEPLHPAKSDGPEPQTETPKDSGTAILGPAPAPHEDPDHFLVCLDCGAAVEMNCPGADEDGTDLCRPTFELPADVARGLHDVADRLHVDRCTAARLLLSAGLHAVGIGAGRWGWRPDRLREDLAEATEARP